MRAAQQYACQWDIESFRNTCAQPISDSNGDADCVKRDDHDVVPGASIQQQKARAYRCKDSSRRAAVSVCCQRAPYGGGNIYEARCSA